ncbi:MAG: aminotransferase class I/II-fold pyridoxal phosphate-dependent enzyme [Bacteroidetes bacterium]|jgi:LL-diaminopimelate aminotransferase|nr:MAG: aminotransferase [Cryomorphaceae bacterium BACL29 MAG-121220-bin8]MDA0758295.1 aminotransferase class I/II-fold pyridoxal phosphate-dependent enzyme [Bacteroidota bacterium]MDA1018732.1 aminotransferase class I/II-fold pyridoxal phosphate-dependent enzyme [Bacteroidota bacterium]|tara:strand:- start:65695 stop:66846 length:1152 start_codon:yes stop_codon:yes gene_type:complete
MIEQANRLNTVEEYYFSKKLREVSELVNSGEMIINMGIGSPDLFPSKEVIEALSLSLNDQFAHKYQSYQGLIELRKAISDFYFRFFKVRCNPDNEVLPLMGSKEGIMHISLAFLNPGDEVLIPNPGYPTYLSVTKLVEAKPIFYNLSKKNNWFPDLKTLENQDLSKVKIMWINYPHMPTGASASLMQFQELILFAKKHNILLINDNPYSFILNNDFVSLLSVDNSMEVAMELNSLSKSFNLSGWRVGMLIGSKDNISKVLKVKSNMDSGMFYGIQKGAIKALSLKKNWFESLNFQYNKRRKLIWELATALECEFDKKSKGLFVWAKLPSGIKSSEKFIDQILKDKKIFIAPGTIFGSEGEGYIRFSLCIKEDKIIEAIKRCEK